jgi:hypothetical protein
MAGYRRLTLSGPGRYASSMPTENGPSERQPKDESDESADHLTN